MVLQTTDGGCLYADVLKTDFRSKWPSKNNFTELDISQSLDWQYPSLSPYYLLIEPKLLFLRLLSHETLFSHLMISADYFIRIQLILSTSSRFELRDNLVTMATLLNGYK